MQKISVNIYKYKKMTVKSNQPTKELAEELNKKFTKKNPIEVIKYFLLEFKNKIAFATSFGAEDQVVTEMIAGIDKSMYIFTLDTGRLFQETYDVMEFTIEKYGVNIHTMFPDAKQVEEMVNSKGINLFYYSVENRKLCCKIRKTEPLKIALKGQNVWITGLRREQSITRNNMQVVEWDEEHKMLKINPLIDWTEEEVWKYIKENNIPYNSLHKQGFRSIGCRPCTRAVNPDEDVRAGRWWWENPENKECGLHQK